MRSHYFARLALMALSAFLFSPPGLAQDLVGERAWFLLDRIARQVPWAIARDGSTTHAALRQGLGRDVKEVEEILSRTYVSPKPLTLLFSQTTSTSDDLVRVASELRHQVVTLYNLQTFPDALPLPIKGEQAYRDSACGNCHGGYGKAALADLVSQMSVPPPLFTEPRALRRLSPYGVYQVLTQGPRVPGKDMPDFSKLDAPTRWALALSLFNIPPTQSTHRQPLKLRTSLTWKTQMGLNNDELVDLHAQVDPNLLRRTLLAQVRGGASKAPQRPSSLPGVPQVGTTSATSLQTK